MTKVCAINPTCCQNGNNKWTAACVALIGAQCGLNCSGNAVSLPAGTWVQACVDKVATVCDASCGTGAPPPEEGKCKEWIPGRPIPRAPGST